MRTDTRMPIAGPRERLRCAVRGLDVDAVAVRLDRSADERACHKTDAAAAVQVMRHWPGRSAVQPQAVPRPGDRVGGREMRRSGRG
ncbi:hypothetical protein GCM10022416_61540 [Actinomadura keratinilytica]|uniref:Uncharacterized protein n=2 Tax=Actinomadura keratinilytica TaxID=547461 RepID=A0ABP6UGX3_9ACTN